MRLNVLPVLVFAGLLLLSQSNTKSKVRIIHADYNQGRKENNEQLRILKGSVHVVKDTIQMFCDSVYYYEQRNVWELMSNVRVSNGHRKIKANKIIYFPDDDLTECLGNVRASSAKDSLFSRRLIYNLKKKDAKANGDVYLWSKNDNAIVTGQKGYFNDAQSFFRVSQKSHFLQIDSASKDSFQVFSEILEYYGDTLSYAYALDSVKIVQGNFLAHCDSAWYYNKSQTAWLKGNPIAWIEKSELTGTVIKAQFDSTTLKHIDVLGKGQAKTLQDSSETEYNILKGKTLEFFIEEKKPKLVIARDNATSLYYLSEQNDKGVNYSTSDSIFVFFKEGELDSIEIMGGAEGIYYPDTYKGERVFGN
jgi:lipopolysaccharide export system protein LptA